MSELVAHPGPDWVVAEMPAGYQNRLSEIQRLIADLHEMGRFARLLYDVGTSLAEAVRDAFAALKFETELMQAPSATAVLVAVDRKRRLLLIASGATAAVEKKSPDVAAVFHMLQDVAGDADRVVLVTNVDAERRPADRAAQVAPDALAFLVRMGASHVTGPTLFNLWKLSLQGVDRARAQVERLHAEEAGTFELSASVLR
jgi:glycine cleavage system pyridoxal-binding protein P